MRRGGVLAWLVLSACGGAPRAVEPRTAPVAAVRAPPSPAPAPVPAVVAAPVAEAPPPEPDPVAALLALDAAASTSVGGPSRGELRGGVALPDAGRGFSRNPRRPAEARFGTVELVQTIVRAAAIVEEALPGSGLVVNDLSLEKGGPIRQHGSHQSGRDADILFYALDAQGAPMRAVGVPLDPTGAGWDFKELSTADDDVRVKLDAPRTWRFVQALLEVAREDVQRIFVVEHLRGFLLDEARRQGAPAPVVERFEQITCQPGTPHDDHMHVRFYCAPDDIAAGCADTPPWYPWRTERLAALGIEPVAEAPRTRSERVAADERTTSAQEAQTKAEAWGPLHPNVRKFLRARRAWEAQPHPGRPFCR